MKDVFRTHYPKDASAPVVFDSPHSGRIYPADFEYDCDFEILQKAEDNYVDRLFITAPDYGAVFLEAQFPRTYIDVNRAIDDIDPALLADNWTGTINPTDRAHAGIGLIRRLARPGIPVYNRKLRAQDIQKRIDKYYRPYHRQLNKLVDQIHYDFGQVWHINCHSMPTHKAMPVLPRGAFPMLPGQPDFVLGDRSGTSCDIHFTHSFRDFLRSLGYRVAINNPYRGVEIVRRYGTPAVGRHSIQLEINKGLYWDEIKQKPSKNYKHFKGDVEKMIAFVTAYAENQLVALAAD